MGYEQIKQLEEDIKEMRKTREELSAGTIDITAALKRFKDIFKAPSK
jgi:hypothetical protein